MIPSSIGEVLDDLYLGLSLRYQKVSFFTWSGDGITSSIHRRRPGFSCYIHGGGGGGCWILRGVISVS